MEICIRDSIMCRGIKPLGITNNRTAVGAILWPHTDKIALQNHYPKYWCKKLEKTSLSFTYVNMEANKPVHWLRSHCVQFTPPWSYLLHRMKGTLNAVKCNFFTSLPAACTETHFNLERPKQLHQLHTIQVTQSMQGHHLCSQKNNSKWTCISYPFFFTQWRCS